MRRVLVILCLVGVVLGCSPNLIVRGPLPWDKVDGVQLFARPDSGYRGNQVAKFLTTAWVKERHRKWVRVGARNTAERMVNGWLRQENLFSTEKGARDSTWLMWSIFFRMQMAAAVDDYVRRYPDLTREQVTALYEGRLSVGIPADAAMLVLGRPDGVEDLLTDEGETRRLTWLGTHYRAAQDPRRTVVTIRDGKIVAIRRGAGAAEDVYR